MHVAATCTAILGVRVQYRAGVSSSSQSCSRLTWAVCLLTCWKCIFGHCSITLQSSFVWSPEEEEVMACHGFICTVDLGIALTVAVNTVTDTSSVVNLGEMFRLQQQNCQFCCRLRTTSDTDLMIHLLARCSLYDALPNKHKLPFIAALL